MREVIDARGLCCPVPKSLAVEAMYKRRVPEILMLVDDPNSRDGILRLAEHLGYKAASCTARERHDEVLLVLAEG